MICFQKFLWQYLQQYIKDKRLIRLVVICFQKFLWQYFQQYLQAMLIFSQGCDLLSKVSLTIFTTVPFLTSTSVTSLWFAFKSFFDNIYNSSRKTDSSLTCVVICFQKFLWQYLQQLWNCNAYWYFSCDLLSKVSLTIFTTVSSRTDTFRHSLWFAFKSFFDNIYNSQQRGLLQTQTVVICFQKFLWQYLQQ